MNGEITMTDQELTKWFKSEEIKAKVKAMPEGTVLERKAKKETIRMILRKVSAFQNDLSAMNRFQVGTERTADSVSLRDQITNLTNIVVKLTEEKTKDTGESNE